MTTRQKDIIKIEKIEDTPMSNFDIKFYLPDVKIIPYSDLKFVKTINQILPKNKSYVIILYQNTQNCGHWVCLMRYDDTIEFFCSYGSKVDESLEWLPREKNFELGITEPYLTNLLKKTKLKVIYNPIPYQSKKDLDISTCGRHCVLRIIKMLEGFDLQEYFKTLYLLKKKLKIDYDKIVSGLITKMSK